MYCAACHGRPLHQLNPVASFECPSHSISDSHYHLLPFADKIDCGACNITVKPQFKRYGDACWCRQALPDRSVHSDNEIGSMCSNHSDKRTMSSCVPVESDGILYRNMYCAACHGRPLYQLHPVALNVSHKDKYDAHLLPFANNVNCRICRVTLKPMFSHLERYGDACWCQQGLPDRSCNNELYEEECGAYSNVTYDRLRRPYNNGACQACDNDGKANVAQSDHCGCFVALSPTGGFAKLFDFTGISLTPAHVCKAYHKKGQSSNPCLEKRCQVGFQVHGDTCISRMTARVCYPPGQNRYNSDFLIANLFRSAIIIHHNAISSKDNLFF